MSGSYRTIRTVGVYALPLLLLVTLWLPGLNQGSLRSDSELYAAIGLHAWREGTLWPLMAGEQAYLNKPPLAIWIHGWFLHVFGVSLWAARLPALLAAILTTVLTVDTVRRLHGRRVAIVAGLILATTLEFFRMMHAVSLDHWLTACLSGAVWCAATVVAGGGRLPLHRILLVGVPIGLSVLVKPFAGLFALPLIAAWLVMERRGDRGRTLLACLGALVVAVAVALPWHWSMWRIFGDGFVAQYIGDQAIARATGAKHNPAPWWAYGPMIARTYWPWMLALAPALWWSVRGVFSAGTSGGVSGGDRAGARLCVLWLGVWLLALSAFADKAPRYLMVLYPQAAWLAGLWVMRAAPRVVRRGVSRWAPMVGAVLCVKFVVLALSPVTIHEPAEAHWAEGDAALEAELRRTPGARVWTVSSASTIASNVYLARGVWPSVLPAEDARDEAERPSAGDLVVFRPGPRMSARAGDEVVFESERLVVVRVGG